ncbi:hypothetical protein ccbrp13_54940 [Ktedonobacteria bacterium brp13]|nr:hypothetical protein ccbrp13_54940 [Ktedonobacteria bacterium brp13]
MDWIVLPIVRECVSAQCKAVPVGLGLGLYISRTLIERHNGQAGVTSKMGVWSIFWFTLPLVQTEEASAMQ